MWCRSVKKQLSALTDGELRTAEALAVEAHLAGCESCRRDRESLRQLLRLTAAIPDEEPSSSLHARIMVRLSYAQTAPPSAGLPPGGRGNLRQNSGPTVGPWMFTALSGATASLVFGALQQRPNAPQPPTTGTTPVVRISPVEPPEQMASVPRVSPGLRRPAGNGGSKPMQNSREDGDEGRGSAGRRGQRPGGRRPARNNSAEAATSTITGLPVSKTNPEGSGEIQTHPVTAALPAQPTEPRSMPSGQGGTPTPDAPRVRETPTASVTPAEPIRSGGEDEGIQGLKQFLEERNRSVPQPPSPSGKEKKSL